MAEDLFTARAYLEHIDDPEAMSASQEDYLEMIYRMYSENEIIKSSELAKRLNVAPSSVSKAISKLVGAGLVSCEKYGSIYLTEKGRCRGAFLLKRHNVLIDFFVTLHGDTALALREAELAEHFMSSQTILKLESLNKILKRFEKELQMLPDGVKIGAKIS